MQKSICLAILNEGKNIIEVTFGWEIIGDEIIPNRKMCMQL